MFGQKVNTERFFIGKIIDSDGKLQGWAWRDRQTGINGISRTRYKAIQNCKRVEAGLVPFS